MKKQKDPTVTSLLKEAIKNINDAFVLGNIGDKITERTYIIAAQGKVEQALTLLGYRA